MADRMITEKVRIDPGWAKAASDAEGFSVVGPIREYSVTEKGWREFLEDCSLSRQMTS